MERITASIILIVLSMVYSNGQITDKLDFGISFQPMISTLHLNDLLTQSLDSNQNKQYRESIQSKFGYEAAFNCDIRLFRKINLVTGITFKNRGYIKDIYFGTKMDSAYYIPNTDNHNYQYTDYYISIPFQIGYNIVIGLIYKK